MAEFIFTSPEGKKYKVNGPEGATREDAFEILSQQIGLGDAGKEKPSALGDFAKSGGAGLVQGTIDTVGAIGSARDFATAIPGYLAKKFGASDQTAQSLSDFIKMGYKLNPLTAAAPSGDEIRNTLKENSTTAKSVLDFKPETTVGQYTKTIAEQVPGALLAPGNRLANLVKFGLAPGVAAETAGQAFGQDPNIRAGAALATNLGMALFAPTRFGGRANSGDRMLAGNSPAADSHVWDAADTIMRDAQARGIRLTPAEAMQQATGGGTGLGKVQRIVESSTAGDRIMAPAMAQRPGQVSGAVNAALDRLAPMREPTPTAIRVQTAADDAIGNIRQRINAAETPYYDAASTRTVPPNQLRYISQDPAFQQAFQNVRADAIRNKDVAAFGANEVPTLIAVRKELARMEQNALNPGMVGNPDRELARGITPIRERLDQIITQSAPSYGQALGVGAGLREQVLAPVQRGPLGQIAQSEDLGKQVSALFPNKPFEGASRETARTIGALNARDAGAAPALTRQYLAQQFAEASQNLQGGPNQYGGAKFAATVQGNPLQRQVLEANIAALPNGQAITPDLRGLFTALEATGKRQQPGSLTSFNTEFLNDLKNGGPQSIVKALTKPLAAAQETAGRVRLMGQTERLANLMLQGPEGLARIREIARTGTGNERAIAQMLLGSSPQLSNQ